MPKTLQGANKNTFTGQAKVAVNGDDMEALDIEVPVQTLLDDAAYLLAELKKVAQALQDHGHKLATTEASGFMSPGDRATITGFTKTLASHRHDNATPEADGFFSKDDKKKLNEVEAKAQVVTKARVETALGIKRGQINIPGVAIGVGRAEVWFIEIAGVKLSDSVAASEYSANGGNLVIAYHCAENRVEVRVRNISNASHDFGATINVTVIPS